MTDLVDLDSDMARDYCILAKQLQELENLQKRYEGSGHEHILRLLGEHIIQKKAIMADYFTRVQKSAIVELDPDGDALLRIGKRERRLLTRDEFFELASRGGMIVTHTK
jgi:hypothetical protein